MNDKGSGEIVDVHGPLRIHELLGLPPVALLERCRRHMARQGTVIWSRAFEINEAGSREDAACWLAEQIMAVTEDR